MEAEYEEMPITQFVERCETHPRIENNFKNVLNAINEIA